MPTKPRRAREQTAPYSVPRKKSRPASKTKITVAWQDLDTAATPIVLERNGEPAAVVLRYADYQRLTRANTKSRQKIWRELDALLETVHSRTTNFSVSEIEADIVAARAETPA